MAILLNACEGLTSGSVTVGNSDDAGGNAFSLTSALVYSTAQKMEGAASISAVNPGNVAFAAFTPATAKHHTRHYQYFSAVPPSGFELERISYTADTMAASLRLGASGSVVLVTKGTVTRETSPTGIVTAGTFLRFELYADAGTSATNGEVRAAVFAGHSSTPLWESAAYTGIDVAGTGAALNYDLFGKYSGTAWTGTFYVDDIGVQSGADAVWAPWPSQVVPTAYEKTIADVVGISDFPGDQTIQFGVGLADGVGITDAASRARSAGVSIADAVGITDAAAAARALNVGVADGVGITDSMSALKENVTPVADAVGITDSVSVQLVRAIVIGDAVGISDVPVVARTGVIGVGITEAVGITDAVSLIRARVRGIGDVVGLTDNVSVSLVGPPTTASAYLGDVPVSLAMGDVAITFG